MSAARVVLSTASMSLIASIPPSALRTLRSDFASAYFSYSEASRAPTAVELGCADPTEPCNLPNALVSDPPLDQVVTRTVETGLRSSGESRIRWNVGWFRAENFHDLLFVASQQTGFGYFTNFGKTRRNGATSRYQHPNPPVHDWWELYVSERYLSECSSRSMEEATAQTLRARDFAGTIALVPGDRIPLIPSNSFKTFAEYQPNAKITLNLDFIATGRSYARGNENNLSQPDGIYYLGQGFSPGYGVLNLGAHYQFAKRVQFFVQINNVLNHRYYTAAQLAPTPYNNAGHFIARPFSPVGGDYPIRNTTYFAPGAPIGAWGGIRFRF